MSPDPTPELQRAQLARLPAYSLFAFFLCSQVTIAAALQLASVPFGLMFSEALLFAVPALLAPRAANWRLTALLKLRLPPRGLIALGFFAGAANFLVAGTLQAAARALLPDLARRFDATHLFEDAGRFELGAVMLALGVVAPLCEELAFRGYLQTVLRSRHREATAVAISAVLFALLHLDPVGMAARIELGVLFGLLVLWSGSLWPAVAAHAANNLIAGTILLFAVRHPHAASLGPRELGDELALGAFGAIALGVLLLTFRRNALRAGAREPSLVPVDPRQGHLPRLAAIRRAALVWMLAVVGGGALFLGLGWRTAQVSLTDALVPLHELERRFPDEASREAFNARVRVERRRARDGKLGLDDYRELRRQIAGLAKGDDSRAPTPGEVSRLVHERDPGAPL